jgi:DNA-binding MarR family transcriptional regulator
MSVNPKTALTRGSDPSAAEGRLFLREEELDRAADLVLRAARRFFGAAEAALQAYDLGPAHYRALAAIRREEGLSVGALIEALGVRKQSLHRVLEELEKADLVARVRGDRDRRERRVMLTEAGREAERAASAALRERLAVVFRAAGVEAVSGARIVLSALADPVDKTP